MKMIKNFSLTALLSLGLLSTLTFTACNRDECKDVVCQNGGTCNETDGSCTCATGYTGELCASEVRDSYVGSYRGSGVDSDGDTYTNFTFTYAKVGTDAKKMQVTIADDAGDPFLVLQITLTSNTTYSIDPISLGTFTMSGNGNLSASTASIVIEQKDATSPSDNLIVTFTNLTRV